MRKMEGVLAALPPPALEGPEDAEITLIGWGSTWGVIHEACEQLAERGIRANHLQIKYLVPFHTREVTEILRRCKRTAVVEANYTGQFARHLRAETGFAADGLILKYDGEPFDPKEVVEQAQAIVESRALDRRVTEDEAREIAYHYIRIHLGDKARPVRFERTSADGHPEPLWQIELADRKSGAPVGELLLGQETGSTYEWRAATER